MASFCEGSSAGQFCRQPDMGNNQRVELRDVSFPVYRLFGDMDKAELMARLDPRGRPRSPHPTNPSTW